jgi:glycine cleavage system protein P-like pyridoxal-binding family
MKSLGTKDLENVPELAVLTANYMFARFKDKIDVPHWEQMYARVCSLSQPFV